MGDMSPANRFVRLCTLLDFCDKPETAREAVTLGEHLVNIFDIGKGWNQTYDVRDTSQLLVNISMWSVFKDMTNMIVYYKTYEDMTLRKIDIKKIDFDSPVRLMMPIRNYKYGVRHIN